jgi:putative mycofactocin binding protein MftB
MSSDAVYFLADGVQVRKEKFGLLFYDYRGPRLYFVPTKDLIGDDFFEGKQSANDLLKSLVDKHSWPRESTREGVNHVLAALEEKGLIHEQSVC